MVRDHIQEGDMILVSPQAKADDGAVVVAMMDGETTVKRLCRRGVIVYNLFPPILP